MQAHGVGLRAAISLTAVMLGLLGTAVMSAPAMAENRAGWELNSHSFPTNLPPGSTGVVAIDVYNVGAAPSTEGAKLVDTLPAGLEGISGEGWSCVGSEPSVCSTELESYQPGKREEPELEVKVSPSAKLGAAENKVSISGGGAITGSQAINALTISPTPAKFGFSGTDAWFTNANGTVDQQAGSHPYEFTFNFALNANAGGDPVESEARKVEVNLPPGLIGNATAVQQCTREQFDHEACPTGSQIGVSPTGLGQRKPFTFLFPIYNLVPPPGHPAEFAFQIFNVAVFLDAVVRSDGDYGITEHVNNIPQHLVVTNAVQIWGEPASPTHDWERTCLEEGTDVIGCPSSAAEVPFLTLPTSCTGPQEFSASVNEWTDENVVDHASFFSHDQNDVPQGLTGCGHLGFNPSISVAPDTSDADTPAGVTVELKTPQEALESVGGIATSNIKDTTVTLPEGVVINPGQAAGLGACQTAESAVGTREAPSCPSNSKVGTDEIETPLLKNSLKGNVYVLQSNPPNLKLLVAASGEGVNLKLVGDVHLDETTGRLTTTFTETPELPFTTFRLSFSGGAQAALATPARCGSYMTISDFTPWSTEAVPDVFPFTSFEISHGSGNGACPGATLPFSPVLTAGSTTDQAGGYSAFSLLLSRADDQQRISKLTFTTPEGLLGMISKVPLCPEPQAAAGTCSAASQIGHTQVTAGPGPYPLVVPEPGQSAAPIYLTGGYKGAPYGLSIVVPVIAGPFNLGTVVVRASIAVDPHTAQLTITTDPLPSILDGIPTDLRTINAVVDRPDFIFNPTNCNPQSFSGTATSTEGTTVPISSHFQMGSCRSLTFKPDFKVSTSGKTSRQDGASLDAKIIYPTGVLGANQATSQANIASVKVDLPKQLPSRLTTLQKACTAAQFDSNPAGCPKESLVGSATAVTPVLPVPLTGPAYFVSHGGEAFPQLIVVLQGYGVTVDLVGDTFISKAGITSSTFNQVPDVPITSFDLSLPEGKFSALASNLPEQDQGDFCGQTLTMPTVFTGQNGTVINQSTPITVEGCSTALSFKHKVKQKTLALSVYAPAAGKITAGGKGLTSQSKTAKGQETLTITLKQKHAGKQKTTVKVAFTPSTGKDRKKQAKNAKLTFTK
jgi:hypothetical protein